MHPHVHHVSGNKHVVNCQTFGDSINHQVHHIVLVIVVRCINIANCNLYCTYKLI